MHRLSGSNRIRLLKKMSPLEIWPIPCICFAYFLAATMLVGGGVGRLYIKCFSCVCCIVGGFDFVFG